jgi:hypothetical protein
MHEDERLEDRESLEGVSAGMIAARMDDLSVAMRSQEAQAIGAAFRKDLAARSRRLLEKWLADNQAFKLELSRLRVLISRLNEFGRRHETRFGSDSHWPEFRSILQQLNEYIGCPHEYDGLEVSQDEQGLYVLCSRCGSTTRDLMHWVSPDKS